jgi:hypothetical protein
LHGEGGGSGKEKAAGPLLNKDEALESLEKTRNVEARQGEIRGMRKIDLQEF